MYDAGIKSKPKNYEIFKLFSPLAYMGKAGRQDTLEIDTKRRHSDDEIIERFYQRFPSLKLMPNPTSVHFGFGVQGVNLNHPIKTYIGKYKALLKKGYKKETAFEEVEKELSTVLENQRDDMRILRGGALALHGNSYLDRA